jgi:AcrR family transcriptional regulator
MRYAAINRRIDLNMPRPAKFDQNSILKAAAGIAATQGPGATTMIAVAEAIGAPSGSLYHRFRTRNELLGRLWLNTAARFQQAWLDALKTPDARQAGLAAALSIPGRVREDFRSARIMLLHRREDFLSQSWPKEMRGEAKHLETQVRTALSQMSGRLFGNRSAAAREMTAFALVDLPYSAVRRYVAIGKPPPALVDDLITKAYLAVTA